MSSAAGTPEYETKVAAMKEARRKPWVGEPKKLEDHERKEILSWLTPSKGEVSLHYRFNWKMVERVLRSELYWRAEAKRLEKEMQRLKQVIADNLEDREKELRSAPV